MTKISQGLEIHVKKAVSLSRLDRFQQMRAQNLSKEYVESKNSYMLLTEVINLKLRLINFAYFFETPGIRVIEACLTANDFPVGLKNFAIQTRNQLRQFTYMLKSRETYFDLNKTH